MTSALLPSPPSPTATTSAPATSSPDSNLPARLHAAGPLLRDLDARGERLLAVRLLAIAKLLGLHQIPDEPQLLQLAGFLRRQFADLTEAELVHAVERWAAGTLAPEAKPYGTLSLDWLGAVLAAYRQDRLAALRTAAQEDARLRALAEPEPAPLPDAFHDGLVRGYLAERGELPLIADWQACWRHLRQTDRLHNFSGEEARAFAEAARAELAAERERCRVTGQDPADLVDPNRPEVWHAHLRARRAKLYYRSLQAPTTKTA